MGPIRRAMLASACLSFLSPWLPAQSAPQGEAKPPALAPAPTPAQTPATVAGAAPAAPALLSSRAAYDEAMRPLDLTRRNLGNWSDVEVSSLNLAIQQAASACALRDALHDAVDDLVDLARLCGVGQNWNVTMLAAHRYIAAEQPGKPQLTQAYADAIEAELHLKMGTAALQTAGEMLAKVPYDGVASGALNQALDYLQFVDTAAAIRLAQTAQPLLLDRLQAYAGLPAPGAAREATALALPQVYRDALRLPALQIYLGQFDASAAAAAVVESSLTGKPGGNLSGDDALLVAAERRRFALLGHRLPLLDIALSLDPERAPAVELPPPNLASALLLFPDWCAQCVRMGPQFPEGKFTVGGRAAVFYALLAQTRPTSSPASFAAGSTPPRSAVEQLGKTPTLLVPAATLLQLEASDYPLLILVDEHGVVRLHQPVGEDALQSGSTLDSALASLPGIAGAAPPKGLLPPARLVPAAAPHR